MYNTSRRNGEGTFMKYFKRVLAGILSITLLLSSTEIVFAMENSEMAEETEIMEITEEEPIQESTKAVGTELEETQLEIVQTEISTEAAEMGIEEATAQKAELLGVFELNTSIVEKNEVIEENVVHNEVNEVAVEEEIYVGDFNLYQYRANMYLEEDSVCNRTIKFMMDVITPSEKIAELLNSKGSFQKKVNAWKAAHYVTEPSEIAEGGIDEKGYYTAIILSVFKSQAENDTYIFDSAKKVHSNTNKILSNMKKWVKEADNIELEKISKNQILTTISIEEQSQIRAYLVDEFKENHPVLSTSSTISSDLAAIFDVVGTLGEAVELMESYIQMLELSNSMKNVLMEMYNQCPASNATMKSALYEAALSTQNLESGLSATILNVTGKETVDVLGILMDEGWEALIKADPYAKAFMVGAEVGTWLGDTICNTLFSTDKTIEQYEKMRCLYEFKELLKTVITSMGITYLNDRTTENAENYFAAIDALFAASDLSCKFAEDYAKILYEDTAIGWITINKQNYSEYMNSVKLIKGDFEAHRDSLSFNYLNDLNYNYPDIYKILMGLEEEDPISVTGILFEKDEIVIGLEDSYIYNVGGITIEPYDATNQSIRYESSDISIVQVQEKEGWLTPINAGTAYITVTTEDGAYTDTICIQVIEGNSGQYAAVEGPSVVDFGMCGEDVEWILYDSGLLVISGSGEMTNYGSASVIYITPWYDYDEIKKIYIQEGITSIGNGAFDGCSSLTEIKLPETVTSIGEEAFEGCSSLTEIRIPEAVTSIGEGAFWGCSSLTEIKIPKEVTSIGDYAFCRCSSLMEIKIPEAITSIGDYAFGGCSSLMEIKIPENVISIGKEAFSGCSSLTEIKIPKGVTCIKYGTFTSCSSLEVIEIPKEMKDIKSDAFYNCKKLKNIYYTGNEETWVQIKIGNYNLPLLNATIHYNSTMPDSIVTAISLNQITANLDINEELQLLATITPSDATNQQLTFSSSDTSVATVDTTGLVKALSNGTATITATAQDGSKVSASCEIIVPYTITYELNGGTNNSKNQATYYNEKVTLSEPTHEGYSFKGWYTDNSYTNQITVIEKGTSGNYILYAKWEKNRISIKDLKITLEYKSVKYDGTTKEPQVTIEGLVLGADYQVSYLNNTDIGEATVVITGIGNYTGTIELSFVIMGSKDIWVQEIPDHIYTGTAQKPQLAVYDGSVLLEEKKDYTVKYSNNTKVGTAKVTITGKGNYEKTIETYFTIVPRDIEDEAIVVTCADKVYNKKVQVSNPVIKYGKLTLKKGTDYTVTFSENQTDIGTVDVFIEGKGNYTGTCTTTYRIIESNISKAIFVKIPTQAYTGEEIRPDITVHANKQAQKDGIALILNQDYEVVYENNIEVGTAKVIVKGKGDYGDSKTLTFAITKRNIAADDIVVEVGDGSTITYDGVKKKPSVKVIDRGMELAEGVDYTITYANNKKAVTDKTAASKYPAVTIKGKGKYTGTRKEFFVIEPICIGEDGIAEDYVKVIVADAAYTKKAVKPAVTVIVNHTVLKNGTDYTLTYANNIEMAEKGTENAPTVTITGKGNYAGVITEEFRIYEKTRKTFAIEKIPNQMFTGDAAIAIEPPIVVYELQGKKKVGDPLTEGIDYEVSYQNNYKVGTAKVMVTGLGEYAGTKTATFKIDKRAMSIEDVQVILTNEIVTYNGKAQKPEVVVMDNGSELVHGTDYTLKYTNNTNASVNSTKKPTITVTGKGTYAGSVKHYFTIEPKQLTASDITITVKDVLFNQKKAVSAAGITSTVTLKDGTKSLKNKTHYTISYTNNKEVGETDGALAPTVTITGKGNYAGVIEKTFRIYKTDISKAIVGKLANEVYSGSPIQSLPEVSFKESKTSTITLVKGEHYTVSWENNVKKGTAKVIITGVGEYGGTKTVTFKIVAKKMTILELLFN